LKISQSFPNVSQGKFLELWNEAIVKAQNSGKTRTASSGLEAYPSIIRLSSPRMSAAPSFEQFAQSNIEQMYGLHSPLNLHSQPSLAHMYVEDCETGSDTYSDFKEEKDL
jgi:hypothetical protein